MQIKPELDTYQKFVKLLQFVKEIADPQRILLDSEIYQSEAEKILQVIGEE